MLHNDNGWPIESEEKHSLKALAQFPTSDEPSGKGADCEKVVFLQSAIQLVTFSL
jgi:hypothetical protein